MENKATKYFRTLHSGDGIELRDGMTVYSMDSTGKRVLSGRVCPDMKRRRWTLMTNGSLDGDMTNSIAYWFVSQDAMKKKNEETARYWRIRDAGRISKSELEMEQDYEYYTRQD